MRKLLLSAAIMLSALCCLAQNGITTWKYSIEKTAGDTVKVVFTGNIAMGYHSYSIKDDKAPTEFFDVELEGAETVGEVYETLKSRLIEGRQAYEGRIQLVQKLRLTSGKARYKGSIFTSSCRMGQCRGEYFDFDIEI